MTIDSVGISNTSGYSFTGGDPIDTGGIVGIGNGITPYTPMTGGGKMRRSLTKKIKRLGRSKVRSVKKYLKGRKRVKRLKRRMKRRTIRQDIIKSIEKGKPISKESTRVLTPSMQSFLAGIQTDSKHNKHPSIIKYSDFKSAPKKKGKKGKKSKKSKKMKKAKTKGGCEKSGRGKGDRNRTNKGFLSFLF